jgi:hypothetical protein
MCPKQQKAAFTVSYNAKSNVIATQISVRANALMSGSDNKNHIETRAIWDTGATKSVISSKLVASLALMPLGVTPVYGVNGVKNCSNYLVDFILPNGVTIQQVTVIESSDIPTDALVGMDIIGLGDFTVTNTESKTKFTYQIPSTHTTDYVAEINNSNNKLNKQSKKSASDIRSYLNKKKGSKTR